MSVQILKILIQYNFFLPKIIFKNLFFNQNQFVKSKILFNTIQYKSDYYSDSFSFIVVPLFITIVQIAQDIQLLINNKNIVSIISIVIFEEKETKNEYTHSLVESNNLYSATNFRSWPSVLLAAILEKLESYNSFKKFSVIIQVKTITKI